MEVGIGLPSTIADVERTQLVDLLAGAIKVTHALWRRGTGRRFTTAGADTQWRSHQRPTRRSGEPGWPT